MQQEIEKRKKRKKEFSKEIQGDLASIGSYLKYLSCLAAFHGVQSKVRCCFFEALWLAPFKNIT